MLKMKQREEFTVSPSYLRDEIILRIVDGEKTELTKIITRLMGLGAGCDMKREEGGFM